MYRYRALPIWVGTETGNPATARRHKPGNLIRIGVNLTQFIPEVVKSKAEADRADTRVGYGDAAFWNNATDGKNGEGRAVGQSNE